MWHLTRLNESPEEFDLADLDGDARLTLSEYFAYLSDGRLRDGRMDSRTEGFLSPSSLPAAPMPTLLLVPQRSATAPLRGPNGEPLPLRPGEVEAESQPRGVALRRHYYSSQTPQVSGPADTAVVLVRPRP